MKFHSLALGNLRNVRRSGLLSSSTLHVQGKSPPVSRQSAGAQEGGDGTHESNPMTRWRKMCSSGCDLGSLVTSNSGWKRSVRRGRRAGVSPASTGAGAQTAKGGRTPDDVLEVLDETLALVDVVQPRDLDEPWEEGGKKGAQVSSSCKPRRGKGRRAGAHIGRSAAEGRSVRSASWLEGADSEEERGRAAHVGEQLVIDDPLGELVPLVDVAGVDRDAPLDVLREERQQSAFLARVPLARGGRLAHLVL